MTRALHNFRINSGDSLVCSQSLLGSSRNAGEERCVTTLITAAKETTVSIAFYVEIKRVSYEM